MRVLLTIAFLFTSAVGYTQPISDRAKQDELVFMRDEEPAMRKAFARASESLNDFFAKAAAASPGHQFFGLKVAISEGEKTEYFWVNNFAKKDDGNFEGTIGNEPRMVKTVKFGQRYSFPRSQIVDWIYMVKSERQMVGNFTMCALLTQESKAEAEATKRRFKLDCDWLQ
jgi:uncharacterized protein YegJ (DUF2314 family)